MSPCGCDNLGDETFDPEFEGPSEDDIARFGDCVYEDDDLGGDINNSVTGKNSNSRSINSPVSTCYECGKELYEDAAICTDCGAFQLKDKTTMPLRMIKFTKFKFLGMGFILIMIVVLLKGLHII